LGYFVIYAPLPLAGLRRKKSARGWKEGREDETWEGWKVRIGGLVLYTWGEEGIASGNWVGW